MGSRFGCIPILLIGLAADLSSADAALTGDTLSDRIAEIEYAHTHRPWQLSQQMIDELRPFIGDATVSQDARLRLMEARNLLLDGRYRLGLETLESVLAMPVDPARRLRALELSINANYHLQNYERAFGLLADALALFSETDDTQRKADVLTLAARLHSDVGEHALALECAAKSLAMTKENNQPRYVFNSLYSLILAQKNAGFVESALQQSGELLDYSQESQDPVAIASALRLVGSVYNAAGRHDEAIGWLRRAVDKGIETGYRDGELVARRELGKALLKTGRTEEGLSMLTGLLEDLRSTEQWLDLMEVHRHIAAAHERNRRFNQALEHLESYNNAAERFADEQRARRLAYLQAEFENRRRNQELALLRRESRLIAMREETAASRRSTRTLSTIMLAIIGLLLIGLLARFRADRRRYRRLAEIDGLTGLFNHRRFHHAVENALAESRARGKVCSLVAADVDLFKQINDRYGHQAGDKVLRKLGTILMEQFPPPCIVGRIGGEEFAIFLPGQNRLQTHQRIREFRERIKPVEFKRYSIEITLSFGLVESRHESRLEKLRARADDALYRAKRSGRNQVVDSADLG